VVEVSSVGEEVNGSVSFGVRVKLQDADRRVRPAMTAGATIVIAELKDVLLVPAQAVRFLDGQRLVYVLRDGRPTPVIIVPGSSSSNELQVLEGDLQPGDPVLLNPPDREGGG
jgi:HlyD family secretion protein